MKTLVVGRRAFLAFTAAAFGGGCGGSEPPAPAASAPGPKVEPGPFESDLVFLKKHTDILLLTDAASGARVAVAPEYQGRVMTSATGGDAALSFGWIGRAAISARARQPHINVFGGEDRFWLGPEGGQYSLYFAPGDAFDLEHWQVPEPLDWGGWDAANQSAASVQFRKRMTLTNYSRTTFEVEVERAIRVLPVAEIEKLLGISVGPGVRSVAFESSNSVTNAGKSAWQPSSGLVSIWILGMFSPSPETTVVLPFISGPESKLGPIVNDAYFGKVPADRLAIAQVSSGTSNGVSGRSRTGVIFFRGDGQYRSKIGISPLRASSVVGSYDAARRALTLVQFNRPEDVRPYVNSMWERQREPYKGDAINSYNDGPPAPGAPPLGPFYELETSSPALSLAPAERYTHVHRTAHIVGPEPALDRIALEALGVGLDDVKNALTGRV